MSPCPHRGHSAKVPYLALHWSKAAAGVDTDTGPAGLVWVLSGPFMAPCWQESAPRGGNTAA